MDGPFCGRSRFLWRSTGILVVVLLSSSYLLVAAFAARNEGSTSAFLFSNRTRRTMSSSLRIGSRSEQPPLKPHSSKTSLQSESFGGFEASSGQQRQQQQQQTTKTSAPQATPLQTAKRMIKEAIDVGAPAYNHGMIEECAKIYLSAATQIVQGALLPEALHKSLETTIISLGRQTIMNPDAIAWAIRGQFDTIIEYQEPFTPRTNAEVAALGDGTTATTAAEAALNFEPFTNQIMFLNDPIVVNDNVMGGQSIGLWDDTRGTFKGRVSLVNNGGFASLRWRMKRTQNWSYAKGIYLKGVHHSKPSQHIFRVLLKDKQCENIRGANYKALFCNPNEDDDDYDNGSKNNNSSTGSTTTTTTTTIQIPFTAFDRMEQMGRGLPGMPPLNRGTVTEIGIMAIQPSVVGDFELTFAEWGLYY